MKKLVFLAPLLLASLASEKRLKLFDAPQAQVSTAAHPASAMQAKSTNATGSVAD